MITAALSNAEAFITALGETGLLSFKCLERARMFRLAHPDHGADELATLLVEHHLLTRFQTDAVLKGEAHKLSLASFTLVDVIGSGSMGTVYRARSSKDSGSYAVKIVPRRNVVNLNTIGEKVEALKQVRHPRVSAMVHVGAQGERVYMAWPLLEGGEKLDAVVAKQGRLAPRQAAQVALQVAMGLQAYHEHGLFHGLLKPSDILIGSDRRVRILDFGVGFLLCCERGKSLLDTTTNNKALAHGIDCASPEAIMDPLQRTPAGDQYSLGCILYFCLTGQFPFTETNPVKKMLAHQFSEPAPVRDLAPECSPRLAAIVGRMMSKKPEERFPNIGAVVGELQAVTSDPRSNTPLPTGLRNPTPTSTPIPRPAVVPSARRTTIKQDEPRSEAVKKSTPRAPAAVAARAKEPVPGGRRAGWLLVLAGTVVGAAAGIATWLLMRG